MNEAANLISLGFDIKLGFIHFIIHYYLGFLMDYFLNFLWAFSQNVEDRKTKVERIIDSV